VFLVKKCANWLQTARTENGRGVGWQHACAMQTNMVPLNFFSIVAPMVDRRVGTRSTRRTCRVVSRCDEPSGIWTYVTRLKSVSVDFITTLHNKATAYTLPKGVTTTSLHLQLMPHGAILYRASVLFLRYKLIKL